MKESSFGFERPEDSPGLLLWQTTITWQRLIKKTLDPYKISHPQFVILAILLWFTEKKQEPTQVLISRLSKLDKMTVSASLKKLAQIGLVRRAEHSEDTRAKAVYLTEKGQAMAQKLVPIVEKVDSEFFGSIEHGKQQVLIHVLAKLVDNA